MAVRIRKDRKTILCAAKSNPESRDCYLDDDVHYTLAVEMKILHTEPDSDNPNMHKRDENGAEYWHFDTVNGAEKYEESLARS